jgi:hypothetical protein
VTAAVTGYQTKVLDPRLTSPLAVKKHLAGMTSLSKCHSNLTPFLDPVLA